MLIVHPAKAYERAHDFGIVTCYFNPGGFRSKKVNYELYMEPIRQGGLDHVTVECAFGDAPFELDAGPQVIQIRSNSVMFQKERLLNIAVAALPAHVTKVAWLDCDILFDRADWAVLASRALETAQVIQPFETAYRLPPRVRHYDGDGMGWRSFAAVYRDDPKVFLAGNFDKHGHTGFAWAARRELLAKHGLYDAMVACCADHIIAHAVLGDWSSACFRRLAGVNNPYAADIRAWSRRIFEDARAKLGVTEGCIMHLWHGSMTRRKYVECAQTLIGYGYDPKVDVRIGPSGAWEWASAKPELHDWVKGYFAQRDEDDSEEQGELAAALP